MGEVHKLAVVASNDGEVEGGLAPLVPAGEYQLRLTHWTTYMLYGRQPKLALWFTILDMGPHFGTVVARHYNVSRLIGNAGKGGRFKAPGSGDLVRDYARLLALPTRFDRFDLQALKSRMIVGRIDTVTQTSRQQKLAQAVWYSVVRELVRLEA